MAAYNESFLNFSLIPLTFSCILAYVTYQDTDWLEKSWVLVLILHALFATSAILLWSLGEARIVYDTKAQTRCRRFNAAAAAAAADINMTNQEYEYAAVLQAATRRKLSLRHQIDPQPPAPTKPTKSAAATKASS